MAPSLKPETRELRPQVLGRVRPLLIESGVLYAARGFDLLRSRDAGESFERVNRLPGDFRSRIAAKTSLTARVRRAGIHFLCRAPDGGMLAVVRGAVLHAPSLEKPFRLAHQVTRGSRPLNIAVDRHGAFFGDYFRNQDRQEVCVHGSSDGRHFEQVHRFAPGEVRHVHGIWPDRFRDGLWMLTGDHDHECGLWFSSDGFQSVERVVGDTQRARAVCIIPEEHGLVVPTDTPQQQNHIQWFDPSSGEFTDLAEVEGSVFHRAEGARVQLLSTAAEPSEANPTNEACVYASLDGRKWLELGRFRRDFFNGIHSLVFGHPQVHFAYGRGDGYLFGYGASIRGLHGRLLRWREDDIVAALENSDG